MPPDFKPDQIALVESPPPLQLEPYPASSYFRQGRPMLSVYEAITGSWWMPRRSKTACWSSAKSTTAGGMPLWMARKPKIVPVDHILRGVYLTPGNHRVEFVFDPLPFKIGKWLTLASLAFFAVMLGREFRLRTVRCKE